MTNLNQSEYDYKFSFFSKFLHWLYTILGNFCYILRHNSNPLSFIVVNLYIYYSILVFLYSSLDLWRELDENVQSQTAFFKATHFSKSGNDSSDAIKSYLKILYH